jgi:CxxC motif-containing protein (DUF1111 family)
MRALFLTLLALAVPDAAAAAGDIDAAMGRSLFERRWTGEGLGPLYNERSCAACHKDGGPARFVALPDGSLAVAGAVVRLGGAKGQGDPLYGVQIQTHGIAGVAPEAAVNIRLTPAEDGLSRVAAEVLPAGAPLSPGVSAALRVAQTTRTAAAIDRVDMAALDRLSDSEGADADGVSGRVRWFSDHAGNPVAGRFGWRAGQTSLEDQTASAFMLDIGLSSPARPLPHGDCTPAQAECTAVPQPGKLEYGGHEMSGDLVSLVAAFVRSLDATAGAAPPDPAGAALFAAAGCAACHRTEVPATGGGTVSIYSDLMLHDMGEGLSDGAGEADVAATEWRTPPLRGLRLDAGPARRYLHDGRAATIAEAIRWHGGEAASARARFDAMDEVDRQRLVDFVGGL